MKAHVLFDKSTGKMVTVGRDGTRYTAEEHAQVQRDAKTGDPAAQAIMANLDLTADFADRDPQEVMRQLMHDCPECRAAAAAGEVPQVVSLLSQLAPHVRIKPRKRRWREQRRRRKVG